MAGLPGVKGQCADLTFKAHNAITDAVITDVTFKLYEGYPTRRTAAYEGCTGSSCGTLVSTVTTTSPLEVKAGAYLVVAEKTGHYTAYKTVTMASAAYEVDLAMVPAMETDQDRIVLRFTQAADLDTYAIDSANKAQFVYYSAASKTKTMGGGTVTLDKDVTSGPGIETVQFKSVTSGTIEVWVKHFSAKFTTAMVASDPANVDIYCFKCLDDNNAVKEGFVKTVTQSDPVTANKWWKAGQWTYTGGANRV